MKTIDLGDLCYIVRKKRDISQEKLIYGICKQSAYSNFEKNELNLPKSISERLVQRLGLSSSDFVFLISKKEFEYQEWKHRIIKLIKEKEDAKALDILHERKEKEDDIQRQFRLFIQGYLTNDLESIEQSLLITLPRINQIYFREIAIAADEMKLLLCYWKKEGRLLKNPKVLKDCIEYTDLYYADKEKVKLLSYELNILKQIALDENDKWFVKYFESKKEALVKKFQLEHCNSLDFEIEKNYILIPNYICNERTKRGLSQAEISEDICSVVTYSRFETGKQDMSKKSIQKIFSKLNGSIIFSM